MSTPLLLTHTADGVQTLTLNRLERKNAFTRAMYDSAAQALAQAAEDPGVHVVVLQGHETVFSAGNDIEEFLGRASTGEESPVMQFLHALVEFPKPLLASVCGPAVGIGTTLLLHCDLVVAGDNAAFSVPFVNLGLCPEAASSLLLPQLMGYHRAAEALLLGEPFLAEAAMEAGLVNRIVPPTQANTVTQALARKLAAKPLSALMQTKALLRKGQRTQVRATLREEATIFAQLLAEPAAREAFTAFLEKRRPDFSKV